jgi:hypothetical protein
MKSCLCACHGGIWCRGGIAPPIPNFRTKGEVSSQIHAPSSLPRRAPDSRNRRVGASQSGSGRSGQ